ncbi:hypothetical protein, partial [Pantoea dispersa]|uniref:hypothetical protein n=1 Tax=Pantoea dispersa TaxID=59814 RepID=UPI0019D353A4
LHALLSRLRCRFAVSVVAHYRDPDFLHNPFFDLFYRLASFHSFRCDRERSAQKSACLPAPEAAG